MRQLIIAVLVPTAIFCIQTALSIPVISDFVKGWDGRTQLGLASALVVLFTGSQLATLIRPFLMLARLEVAELNRSIALWFVRRVRGRPFSHSAP